MYTVHMYNVFTTRVIPQATGSGSWCVWGAVEAEEAHGRPGHTGEGDTAQDMQEGQ